VQVRALTPDKLAELAARRILKIPPDPWVRIGVDGAPAAGPHALADALVDRLRAAGRPVLRISTEDFLRPASLRLEHGRTNPDSYYMGWFDENGLRRTVLDPLSRDGSGQVVTSLWDAGRDRASRAPFVTLPAGGIAIVSGPLLQGAGLPFDYVVHLWMSASALARKTTPELAWTLPAFQRYEVEVSPADLADLVARVDHSDRPALVERAR
jgi:hypothetical protein